MTNSINQNNPASDCSLWKHGMNIMPWPTPFTLAGQFGVGFNIGGYMKHTPGPWKIDDNLVDVEFSTTDENWGWCSTFGKNQEANARLIAAAPDQHKALYFLGGGNVYLEAFGRLCFCSGCRIGEKGAINKHVHSSSCEDAWKAYSKAEGGQ